MVIQKLQAKLYILKGRTMVRVLRSSPTPTTCATHRACTSPDNCCRWVRVKAYDPIAMNACKQQRSDLKIRYCESVQEVAQGADALVVVTEWSEFRALDLPALATVMANPILVDGRNVFRPETAAAAGFDYTGVGRNARPRQEIGTSTTVRK